MDNKNTLNMIVESITDELSELGRLQVENVSAGENEVFYNNNINLNSIYITNVLLHLDYMTKDYDSKINTVSKFAFSKTYNKNTYHYNDTYNNIDGNYNRYTAEIILSCLLNGFDLNCCNALNAIGILAHNVNYERDDSLVSHGKQYIINTPSGLLYMGGNYYTTLPSIESLGDEILQWVINEAKPVEYYKFEEDKLTHKSGYYRCNYYHYSDGMFIYIYNHETKYTIKVHKHGVRFSFL